MTESEFLSGLPNPSDDSSNGVHGKPSPDRQAWGGGPKDPLGWPPQNPVRNGKQRSELLTLFHLVCGIVFLLSLCGAFLIGNEAPQLKLEEKKIIPAEAKAEDRNKLSEENRKIDARNAEIQVKYEQNLRRYQNGGKASRENWQGFSRFLVAITVAIWLAVCVFAYALSPLYKILVGLLGKEFTRVLSPLFGLAMAVVLSRTVLSALEVYTPSKAGFLATLYQIFHQLLRPAAEAIVSFGELLLKNWVLGSAYLVVVLFVAVRHYFPSRSENSNPKS